MPNIFRTDVTIIGAGVIGAALARELSRYELHVLVIEKEADVGFGTSKSNSGIIHSGIHDKPGTTKARFCLAGNKLYPELAAELDVPFKNNGTIVVARDTMELPLLDELHQNGLVIGVPTITRLNPSELLHLEPNLSSDLAGGLFIPNSGIIMPFDLVFGLIENAQANGVELWLNSEVIHIEHQTNSFLISTGQGSLEKAVETNYLVNAAGLFSSQIAKLLGDNSFTVRARKGEEYLLDRRLEGMIHQTIFPLPAKNSKGILVIPTVDGNIMIGPTAHHVNSTFDLSTSTAGWQEVFNYVQKLVPSISPADMITSFAGLRAIADCDDFIIAPSSINSRFIHAAGIQSPGLTAAPAIARHLVELLHESGLQLRQKRGFNPERRVIRMRNLDAEHQAALMKTDPAYANIVCRCELISEAEIREAIRRGASTLDGIKLRTRSGMGRCQGGFCTPRLIKILSEELNIDPLTVTKNGPGSTILSGRLRSEKEGDYDAE